MIFPFQLRQVFFTGQSTGMALKRLLVVCLFVIFNHGGGKTIDRGTVIELSDRHKRDVDGYFRINSFVINSTEALRFAKVQITSSVENLVNLDKEFNFRIRIPKTAFISGFVLRFGDVETRAEVAEKGAAQEVYQSAQEQNVTAGHVTQQSSIGDEKDRDVFEIAVNIAKRSTVEFRLEYYEFLERHAGVYSQTFYILPRNLVRNLQIVCDYTERQKFSSFNYKAPFADERFVTYEQRSDGDGYYSRRLDWDPEILDGELDVKDDEDEAFEITYELEPLDNGGHMVYNENGDFAHYFSTVCDSDQILPKKVIFVIDVSGSMKGVAMEQVRVAIGIILDELRYTDYFNLILFSDGVKVYSHDFVAATDSNVAIAKRFVQSDVVASGSTDMNAALLRATHKFDQIDPLDDGSYVQTLVFLTDGSPTAGETNRDKIRTNLRQANYIGGVTCCKSSMFTIAFSKSPDIQFLQKLTDDHLGSLRVIRDSLRYEISQELVHLYSQIHNPYYRNLRFSFYRDGAEIPEDDITQSYFLQYDCGGEIVVGGHTEPGAIIQPRVEAEGAEEEDLVFQAIPTVPAQEVSSEMLARLVAYKRVKELLIIAASSKNKTRVDNANQLALAISLEMEFVTPVTSLVVALFKTHTVGQPSDLNTKSIGSGSRGFGGGLKNGFSFNDYGQLYDYPNLEVTQPLPGNAGRAIYAAKFVVHLLMILVAQIL